MKIDVTITNKRGPRKSEDESYKGRPWPTMLFEDEPLWNQLVVEFYDGGTKWDEENEEWIDIPGFTRNDADCIKKIWESGDVEFHDADRIPSFMCPTTTNIEIYASVDLEDPTKLNPRVPESVIAEEYDIGNKDRFKRKPLGPLTRESRKEGNRWMLGGSYYRSDMEGLQSDFSFHNIRFQLKSSKDSDPFADVNMDLYLDGKNKVLRPKRLDYYEGEDFDPLTYEGNVGGRYYPSVQELSTKSFCHYDVAGKTDEESNYTYDWIEGIYFQPFDLSKTDEFKVTQSPSFTAAEVNGAFMGEGKWKCFLMPRRWAFYTRYRDHSKNGGTAARTWNRPPGTYIDVDGWSITTALFDQTVDAIAGGTFESWNPITGSTSIQEAVNIIGLWWGRCPHDMVLTLLDFGEAWNKLGRTEKLDFGTEWCRPTTDSVDMICAETLADAKAHALEIGMDQEFVDKIASGGSNASFHMVASKTEAFVRCFGIAPYDAPPPLPNPLPPEYGLACGAEAWLNAVRHDGCGQIHGTPVENDDGYSRMTATPTGETDDKIALRRIWKTVEGGHFWQEYIKPLKDQAAVSEVEDMDHTLASSTRIVPWGIALSPSTTGELVAILVDQNQNAYYIWRKTDEDFEDETDLTLLTNGDYSHFVSFETTREDGVLAEWENGEYPEASHIFEFDATSNQCIYSETFTGWGRYCPRDFVFCDQFTGNESRKLTHIGRIPEPYYKTEEECGRSGPGWDDFHSASGIVGNIYAQGSGPGAKELPCPLYVMVADDRYLENDPRGMQSGYSPYSSWTERFLRHHRGVNYAETGNETSRNIANQF